MRLTVNRYPAVDEAVIGTLSIDGEFECYSLEHLAVIIPVGTYQITLYNSPHAGHIVPLLQNVPDRDLIEIHSGNSPEDSRGCILVGQTHTSGTIGDSRLAFAHLLPKIQNALQAGDLVFISVS